MLDKATWDMMLSFFPEGDQSILSIITIQASSLGDSMMVTATTNTTTI